MLLNGLFSSPSGRVKIERVGSDHVAKRHNDFGVGHDQAARTLWVVWVRDVSLDRSRADSQVVGTLVHLLKIPELHRRANSVCKDLLSGLNRQKVYLADLLVLVRHESSLTFLHAPLARFVFFGPVGFALLQWHFALLCWGLLRSSSFLFLLVHRAISDPN